MKEAGSTTYEKRLKIVRDYLVNDRNYGAMAIKYHCSYQKYRQPIARLTVHKIIIFIVLLTESTPE